MSQFIIGLRTTLQSCGHFGLERSIGRVPCRTPDRPVSDIQAGASKSAARRQLNPHLGLRAPHRPTFRDRSSPCFLADLQSRLARVLARHSKIATRSDGESSGRTVGCRTGRALKGEPDGIRLDFPRARRINERALMQWRSSHRDLPRLCRLV